MTAPTFVATFTDGTKTRMSTHTSLARLDLKRGIALARAAYESRKKQTPPALDAAHFELEGMVLCEYTAKELAAAVSS
jgi:hypothetical protein